ncbi:MAG: immunoglobulin domain-containing protein [Verrucomicrobiota bacterium]
MTRRAKRILPAGLAFSLVALAVSAQTPTPLGGMPLFFEANRGQADHSVQFIARGRDSQFLILPAEAQIVLRQKTAAPSPVRMQFMDANPRAQIRGDAELPGKINYLTGNDPAQWRTGVPLFAKVRVDEIYPGIGLVYYGTQQQLEYDFEIAPGADPDAIKIHFDGLDKIAVSAQGELVLILSAGEIRQPRPVLYQTVNGLRREISGGYRLVSAHTVAFTVGNYDHSLALVIDPLLNFSTYFGGNAGETAWAVKVAKVDTNSFIYIAGQTFSSEKSNNVPLSTPGAFQTNYNGGSLAGDAFVAKFDNLGQNLIYFTYLGGSSDNAAYALAVDNAGDAYVAGFTTSTNFPVTNSIPGGGAIHGPIDPFAKAYLSDAFVAELDAGGSNLVYSSYIGGAGADSAYGIALDSSNNAYVTGFTYSTNFPATTDAFQKHLGVTNSAFSSYYNANAFVAEIGAAGTNLLYSTFFGGTNFDEGRGIAVDSSNYVYVTGFTGSQNFPTTNAVYQPLAYVTYTTNSAPTNQVFTTNLVNGSLLNGATNHTPGYDAFVARFNPSFAGLLYSTFLGGTNNDQAFAIAADTNGAAYVTGWTVSTNFPNSVAMADLRNGLINNLTSGFNITTNAFLTKIIWNGTNASIESSTVFGGTNRNIDIGYGVALDPSGNVYVTGSTSSTNFPAINVPGLTHGTNAGGNDAFVVAFSNDFSGVLYSAYLGGSANDVGYGIAADTNNAYVVGQTLSANFPVFYSERSSPFQGSLNGTNDAFLAAIMLVVPPPNIFTNQEPINQTNAAGSTISFSINGTSVQPFFFQWQYTNSLDTNLLYAGGTNLVNGGRISGATNVALTITDAQTNDSGHYWIIVTNFGGAVTSTIATLRITNVPVVITVQPPTNQLVGVGATATFSVTATGTPPLIYQWYFNGSPLTNGIQDGVRITGVTNATLTITNVQLANAGTYLVAVTNVDGSVISSNAVLTVLSAPVITVQPTDQAMAVGATAILSVTAVGQVPLRYHWQFNGTNLVNGGRISGATNAALVISNAQTNDSGNYMVVVTNVVGSVTSSNAVLLVTNIPPAITVQPTNQTVGVGTTATLVVSATGTAPLRYQWQTNGVNLVNGGNLSGVTNAILTISNVRTNDSGNYSVIVTNYGGSVTSSVAVLTTLVSPVITVQPTTNQAMAVGATAIFSVTAIGQVPLSYHWQFNGSNLVNGVHVLGATTSMLTITNAQTTNSGIYSVTVTNIAGSVTSSNAVLLVTNIPPTITLQPTNQAVTVTSNVTFAVTATGTVPLSYQWQFKTNDLADWVNLSNGGKISGATSTNLTITNAQATNGGSYSVIVTNAGGAVTSSVVVLTVAISPVITVQPTNQSMAVGTTATFVVAAVGKVPLSFQWQVGGANLVNGGNISGATAKTLTISNAQTTNSGTYTVIVTNTAGSVTSSNAVLTVTNIPPAIIVQPTNQTVTATSNVTFVVTATGTTPLSYQWQVDGTNLVDGAQISGSISNVLTISGAQPTNGGIYTVTVTNNGGSVISSNAILTVAASPLIVLQPTNQAMAVGATATFVVAAVGIMPLSYQWQVDGTNLVDEGQISGSTSNVLTIASAQPANSGVYTVIVTNIAGSVTSSNAVLTVAQFSFANIVATGDGSFILSGAGGTNGGTYYVLTSTNLLTPLDSWTPIATNQFDNFGGFMFTNAMQTSVPQLFYILKQP